MNRAPRWLVAIAIAALASLAGAEDAYPSRPLTIVVPYAPGGVADALSRAVAQPLGEALGTPVLVDNRAGGGGLIGTDYVAKAKPDGYTLVMMIDTNTIAPSLYPKLNHDPIKSFAPITLLAKAAQVIVAHPSFAPNTLQELVALSKSKPKPIFYASSGNGTSHHLAMERIKLETGAKLQHIPYKGGGPALIDLVAGQVPVGIIGIAVALPQIKAGNLKALATTGLKRSPVLPDVPTVAESGLEGFETFNWFGLLAPAGTPKPIVDRLHGELLKIMHSPAIAARAAAMSLEITTSPTPGDFRRFMVTDIAKWPPLIKAAHITVD
jgi:tripartite-type tricarboxylate transporter receptor subunit TctC